MGYGVRNSKKDDYTDSKGNKKSKYYYDEDGSSTKEFDAPALPDKDATAANKAVGDITEKYRKLRGSFKKGGKVKKTGAYKLHKGERVLNPTQTKKFEAAKKKFFGIKKYGKN